MSSPNLGVPIGPDIPRGGTTVQFEGRIPRLRDLLPNGGWPGVVYAQVCVHNVANAGTRTETPANLRPIRGTTYYEVVGPKGRAQMALVGCGKPIAGASPDSGERLCFVDGEVARLTGLPVGKYPIWLRTQPEEEGRGKKEQSAPGANRPGQGGEGDGRVQARNPAQRQQPGSGGQEP